MKRLLSLLLAALLAFSLSACGDGTSAPTDSQPADTAPAGTPEPSASQPDDSDGPADDAHETSVRLAFLNGPTGIGAAKLLSDIDAGTTTLNYSYEVLADNNEAVNLLTTGGVDIAALATNVALNLYNKTENIQLLALNTAGVLYILEGSGGQSIQSMADLEGKTVYAYGQGANPQYILENLLRRNGLNPETDLTLQWAAAEEVSQALLSGEADAAMLPVPAATAASVKGDGSVRFALDLTDEWESAYGSSSLYMGCLVVRREFAETNPQAVQDFLADYSASVQFVSGDPAAAAPLAEQYGLAPSAAIAEKAIPDCSLVCLYGSDLGAVMADYYQFLFDADPDSIGGSLPDDGFYYAP